MSGPGFIDHIGFGVPDLAAAKEYYDDLMAVLGFREWFATVAGDPFNYGPDDARGGTCSSTRQRSHAATRGARPAFTTMRSWSRAERSSGKRTVGHVRATP